MTMTTIQSADAKQPNSYQAWVVCLSAALFFLYEFIQLNAFNAINQPLLKTFHIDAGQLGILSSVYFISNVFFLFPAGMLLDRYSARKVILTTLGICITGTLIFAISPWYTLSLCCRMLTGVGSAFCFLGSIRLASRWFPMKQMALITAVIVSLGMLGGVIAQTPMMLLVEHLGWRNALLCDVLLGSLIWFVICKNVKNFPPNYPIQDKANLSSWKQLKISLSQAFTRLPNWLAALYACLLNLPIFVLGAIWGVPYLHQVQHLSLTAASLVTSTLFIGTVVGGPLVGLLSDRSGRRKPLMILGAFLTLALLCLLQWIPTWTFSQLLLLFFAIGVTSSTQILTYPLITAQNPISLTASANSVVSLCCLGSGAIAQPLFGWLLDVNWHGKILHGIPFYTAHDFFYPLLMLPIAAVLGLVMAIAISEKRQIF